MFYCKMIYSQTSLFLLRGQVRLVILVNPELLVRLVFHQHLEFLFLPYYPVFQVDQYDLSILLNLATP